MHRCKFGVYTAGASSFRHFGGFIGLFLNYSFYVFLGVNVALGSIRVCFDGRVFLLF